MVESPRTAFVSEPTASPARQPLPAVDKVSGPPFRWVRFLAASLLLTGVVLGSWHFIFNLLPQWRHEKMTQRWDELAGQPADSTLESLQQRHGELVKFHHRYPDHEESTAALDQIEKTIGTGVALAVKEGDFARLTRVVEAIDGARPAFARNCSTRSRIGAAKKTWKNSLAPRSLPRPPSNGRTAGRPCATRCKAKSRNHG